MARAAAKRRQPARPHDTGRRRKDSGGQRYEDTLFFSRLRNHAKWVFVFLALVFGLGFVVFGVGSSSLGGSLSDIFQGVRGNGSGATSVKKALKETEQNPKVAKGWRDLATAYDTQGDVPNAIEAWKTYTALRPKDVEGWTQLATDYTQQFNNQTLDAQAAQIEAQSEQQQTFGPPPDSALGRSFASVPDPIGEAVSAGAGQKFNDALTARQRTGELRAAAYNVVAKLQPDEPAAQLQLADAAKDAASTTVAIAAYKRFIKLAPDDNQVPYAKQQIKALQSQLPGAAQG